MFTLRVELTGIDDVISGISALDERRRLGLPDSAARLWQAHDGHPSLSVSESAAREVAGRFAHQETETVGIPLRSFGPGDLVEGPDGRWAFGAAMTEDRLLCLWRAERERAAAEEVARHRQSAERAAAHERQRAANDAAEAARKAQDESALAALRTWGEAHGSPLLQARIAEGFEFRGLARQEFAESVIESLSLPFVPVDPDVPDGYSAPECHDRTTPTLEEIEALRIARAACQGQPARAELAWLKYEPADGSDLARTELRVTVTCPDGVELESWFHPTPIPTPMS